MTIIAVTVDPACGADERTMSFWCAAIDQQAAEFAQAWSVPYTPVVYYSTDVLLALQGDDLAAFTRDARLLTVQPSLDVDGALGYHDDVAGVIFARVMWQGDETPTTISHEVLEEMGDPTCDAWASWPGNKRQALEASDRVEGDTYLETATIGGDSMPVPVSNYLLPAAFQEGSQGPWDRMGRLTSWDGMTPGGYVIVQDADGNVSNVFAKRGEVPQSFARKLSNPDSRTLRRLRNPVRPRITAPEGQAA